MHCCKPHGRLNPSKQRKGEEEGEGGRGGGGGRTEMLESEDMAGSCCDGETSSGRERGCASDILDVCILSSPFCLCCIPPDNKTVSMLGEALSIPTETEC